MYTGRQGGNKVPQDVVRVRVNPSVPSIPAEAFEERKKLTEVELCEGLMESFSTQREKAQTNWLSK